MLLTEIDNKVYSGLYNILYVYKILKDLFKSCDKLVSPTDIDIEKRTKQARMRDYLSENISPNDTIDKIIRLLEYLIQKISFTDEPLYLYRTIYDYSLDGCFNWLFNIKNKFKVLDTYLFNSLNRNYDFKNDYCKVNRQKITIFITKLLSHGRGLYQTDLADIENTIFYKSMSKIIDIDSINTMLNRSRYDQLIDYRMD
jgi:hypothetical protein